MCRVVCLTCFKIIYAFNDCGRTKHKCTYFRCTNCFYKDLNTVQTAKKCAAPGGS